MGFDDRGIVALSGNFISFLKFANYLKNIKKILNFHFIGAHAVGRCHTDRSGFWGPWTHAESTLSNEYFRLMFEEKWTPKKTHKGMFLTAVCLHF